jgi:vancomycin resistance protein YoaR
MKAIAAAIVANPDAASVRARFKVTSPGTTTEQIRALKITDLVSEFSTPYNCCEPRVTNIQRAAEILNGTIIPAGRTFSLNDALGQRTIERGFVAAPQIAAGMLEDAVGGGISQVATTLYNAAFFAGLRLDSHTPHQFWISRYPKGREATVSFGGPELVFTNDWDAGILINAYAGSNGITIRFFSSPLGRRVETETGEARDVVQPTVKETVNPDLEPGARVVEQDMGGAGFTVSYTRKVWAGDALKSEQTFTWKYDPQNAYVEIGPPETTPSTTTAPDGATTAPDGQTTAPEQQPAPSPTRTRTAAPGAAAPPP